MIIDSTISFKCPLKKYNIFNIRFDVNNIINDKKKKKHFKRKKCIHTYSKRFFFTPRVAGVTVSSGFNHSDV